MKKVLGFIRIIIFGWVSSGVCGIMTILTPTEIFATTIHLIPSVVQTTVYNANGVFIGTYTTIQAGVDACPVNGTVSALTGTYNEVVYIKKKIALVGVGTPTITTFGLGETNTVTFDGNSTDGAVLAGFIITGATGNYPNGSGIYCNNGSPIIINNTISVNNFSGIYCDSSSPTITNNMITGNSLYGIYCDFSSPTITNNIISGSFNGIDCHSSSPEITNNTIVENGYDGIYCDFSSPTITNNIISGSYNGNGIDCYFSSPEITNNTIAMNSVLASSVMRIPLQPLLIIQYQRILMAFSVISLPQLSPTTPYQEIVIVVSFILPPHLI